MNTAAYSTLELELRDGIADLRLNRPGRARVVVLRGRGDHFCSGIDLDMLAEFRSVAGSYEGCAGRVGERLRRTIL